MKNLNIQLPIFGFALMAIACTKPESAKEDLSSLKIAYNVYYDTANDNYEIFTMDPDGGNPKNISNNPGVDWLYYAWRDKLYFISDRDTTHRMYFLFEMDADGNNVRKISDLRLEDSWLGSRNNGSELVVSGRIGKATRYQLFLINVATGKYQQLTTDTTAQFADPCFSPDGNKIAFRYRSNRKKFQTEKAEIWIMDADGSNKSQLTHYPDSDTTAEWHSYHAGAPQWFSTEAISYMSRQKSNYSIFITSLDGSTRQLTTDELNEGWHAWSPKGQWIVGDQSELDDTKYDIYIMDSQGANRKKITSDWRTEQAPLFVERPSSIN